jgi:hypothetical protein
LTGCLRFEKSHAAALSNLAWRGGMARGEGPNTFLEFSTIDVLHYIACLSPYFFSRWLMVMG